MNVGAPAGGMNNAAFTAVRVILRAGHKPWCILNGFSGLMRGEFRRFQWIDVEGWATRGGSELGTNRTLPEEDYGRVAYQLQQHDIHALLIVGGFEGYHAVLQLFHARDKYPAFCIPIVHLPATVSNNVPGTDYSLGTDTALNAIVEACDRVKQSATSVRRRVFVVEVHGGRCGYLATMAAVAVRVFYRVVLMSITVGWSNASVYTRRRGVIGKAG